MSHVICVDGLAGNPNFTFASLKNALEKINHKVHLMQVAGILTHQDRIDFVLKEINRVREEFPKDRYFLVGQSAGGSAVRCAAATLVVTEKPHGIVLLSPAMPSGISFTTIPLARVMMKYWFSLFCRSHIILDNKDYINLLSPLRDNDRDKIIGIQIPISSREARKLAFNPDPYVPVGCNCTIVYGSKDRWISPRAYERLREVMCHHKGVKNHTILTHRIMGTGHHTLLQKEAILEVCRAIY